jgi:4-hydroxy-tetrahydrodipicolinate synthase
MAELRLRGAYTALVTPFTPDGSAVDWDAFDKHIEAQIVGGVEGLVPCGTTGEAPTLSGSEQEDVIRHAVSVAKGRAVVLAGTGTNNTASTIEASRRAVRAGADAVMVVMPYYNKPSQLGLIEHVRRVASAVEAPVVLYNIPGRCAVELSVDSTLKVLEQSPNVVGIKDATANVLYCQELVARAGDRVMVLCGDDALTLAMMSVGARGVISVTSNVYPRQVEQAVVEALEGRWNEARRRHFALLPVHRAMFCEPSPQPAKAALALKGRMASAVRPPLVEAGEQCRSSLADVMRRYEAL